MEEKALHLGCFLPLSGTRVDTFLSALGGYGQAPEHPMRTTRVHQTVDVWQLPTLHIRVRTGGSESKPSIGLQLDLG
jgi:hypothetical protein